MSRKLTKKQAALVRHIADGMQPTKAARLVGYSSPTTDAFRTLRLPHVLEELRERRDAVLKGDLAQVALHTMRDLMGSDTPAATRYQASKWVLEHAGHEVEEDSGRGQSRALEDMNADELAHAVQSGMTALQELAGQLEGKHYIEGQAREVRDVDLVGEGAEVVEEESADFLD